LQFGRLTPTQINTFAVISTLLLKLTQGGRKYDPTFDQQFPGKDFILRT
jgi:hypothetical protein